MIDPLPAVKMKQTYPMRHTLFTLGVIFFWTGCTLREQAVTSTTDFYTTALFHEVQRNAVFADSKTFADCIPKRDLTSILRDYEHTKEQPGFDLETFVYENFDLPERPQSGFVADTSLSMETHLHRLWPVLTRRTQHKERGSSLIPLPYDYVVPGGRFSEIYYWDSYFTMLGLHVSKRDDLIRNMVNNFTYLIQTYGFIPNGNRHYYLTRSQPPFFSLMVRLLETYDTTAADRYLDAMLKEYNFWMDGMNEVKKPGDAVQHVVMMPGGNILNRYYDKGTTPRPESYKEDYALAQQHTGNREKLYRDLRSAAESGWDFSSRWFEDGKSLKTIHTTDMVPVDLNSLLVHLERMIAKGYQRRGEERQAREFIDKANLRQKAILAFCWDADKQFFTDYDFTKQKRSSILSLAGVYPLFFHLAEPDMAAGVAAVIQRDFLKPGGLVPTLNFTGEQWDAPNGWAPLHWMAYRGLKNYGYDDLAYTIRDRWLRQNVRVYEITGMMMEKYNVIDSTLMAGGGEYPNQDGFGWTNGVALVFLQEKRRTSQAPVGQKEVMDGAGY